MLNDLDTIDWQNLHHAYGPAGDVPYLLRALATDDEALRRKAMFELYGTIWHQGTVYEASSYAVPFLIELLESESVQGKGDILGLLASLASGSSYKAVHQHAQARIFGEEFVQSPQYQAELQQELAWVQQAHYAVAGAINLYLRLLEHSDPKVRVCVLYLLLSLPECLRDSRPVLRKHLQDEKDRQVRASLLLALAAVTPEYAQEYGQICREIASNQREPALVRLAAAIALLSLQQESNSDMFSLEFLQQSIEVMTYSHEVKDLYEVFIWESTHLIPDLLEICGLPGSDALEQMLLEH